MGDDIAIRVEHVSKTFKLPHEKQSSLKGSVVNFWRQSKGYEVQKALDDVSFEVKKGEFFGIVGRNGSGKSTLLKLLAGIYSPTSGEIQVKGKLTPFIELGVGFNPELTGRENVFLNGALLGFNRKEMTAMYDEIVEFAELERFMDQKLKNYSSGMQVRLAFSIAIRAESDILVLDEVLAVGDEAFQRKCLDVFEKYKTEKRTVVLVTHDMDTIRRFCDRALVIDSGSTVKIGSTDDVADVYSRFNARAVDRYVAADNSKLLNDLQIVLKNTQGQATSRFEHQDVLVVELIWHKDKTVTDVGVKICSESGENVYATNTFIDKHRVKTNRVRYQAKLDIGAGKYYIVAATFNGRPENKIDFISHGPVFFVDAEKKIKGNGIAVLKHEWREG